MTTENIEKGSVLRFIAKLETAGKGEKDKELYKRAKAIASRSRRQRITVNLGKLGRCSKENETVIVPGKVLGTGEIGKKISVCAMEYSAEALEKLKKSGCEILDIDAAIKKGKARLIA